MPKVEKASVGGAFTYIALNNRIIMHSPKSVCRLAKAGTVWSIQNDTYFTIS